jgi:hypothetical protein
MIARGINSLRLSRSFGLWKDVPTTPADPILGLNEKFKECQDKRKVNLTVGAYRDENGKPLILPSVKMAMKSVYENTNDHEYIPILGDKEFVSFHSSRSISLQRLLMARVPRPLLKTESLEFRLCQVVEQSTLEPYSSSISIQGTSASTLPLQPGQSITHF